MNFSYPQMQHLITEFTWSVRQLMDQAARDISATLPRRKLTALIVDESGRVKKAAKAGG